jgi:autoinducer 2-degrading protein
MWCRHVADACAHTDSTSRRSARAQVALLSRFKAKPGRAEELIAAFGPVFEQAEREPGTLLYVLHRSTDDPELFWVCEVYADDDAFAAHRGSDAMAAATPALAELIAEPELTVGEPVIAKGLPA